MSKITSLAKHLTLQKDLGPQRDYNERGRLRKTFSTFGSNLRNMVAINFLVDIFALPLIIMFVILMGQYEQTQLAEAGYSFSGFLGIGYGLTDDTIAGITLIYGIRQKFFLYFLTPSLMILSIGLAGAYHCIRNYYWGVEVKILKHFFRGIKLHWWKFLLSFTVLGVLATNAAYATIELIKIMSTVGSASAGIWIWSILSLLVGLLTLIYFASALPMFVCFKFKLKDYIKNSCISALIFFILGLVITVIVIAPTFLVMAGEIFKIIFYLFMITLGGSLYMMVNIGFGNFSGDLLINALYEYEQEQANKAQLEDKKKNKNSVPAKQKQKKGKRK